MSATAMLLLLLFFTSLRRRQRGWTISLIRKKYISTSILGPDHLESTILKITGKIFLVI